MRRSTRPRTPRIVASFAALLLSTTAHAQTAATGGSGPFDLLRKGWPLLIIVGVPLLIVLVRYAARANAAREAERWRSLSLTLGGTLLMRERKPTQPAGLRLEVGEWTAIVDEKTKGGEGGSPTFVRFRIPFTATRPFLLVLMRLGPVIDRLLRSPLVQNRMESVAAKQGVSPLAIVEVGDCTMYSSDQPLAQPRRSGCARLGIRWTSR